jgi:hypothetical protein
MFCPTCNKEGAYVGLFTVECSSENCLHFSTKAPGYKPKVFSTTRRADVLTYPSEPMSLPTGLIFHFGDIRLSNPAKANPVPEAPELDLVLNGGSFERSVGLSYSHRIKKEFTHIIFPVIKGRFPAIEDRPPTNRRLARSTEEQIKELTFELRKATSPPVIQSCSSELLNFPTIDQIHGGGFQPGKIADLYAKSIINLRYYIKGEK